MDKGTAGCYCVTVVMHLDELQYAAFDLSSPQAHTVLSNYMADATPMNQQGWQRNAGQAVNVSYPYPARAWAGSMDDGLLDQLQDEVITRAL
jgi:hypothetical protein